MKLTDRSQILDLIKKIYMNARHITIKHFDDYELTVHQIYIMKQIKKNPNINLTLLGNCMNLAKSSISLTVNKLVEEGFVLREEDLDDRRNKHLSLTQSGEEKLKEAKKIHQDLFDDLLSDLSNDDILNIKSQLKKLDSAIESKINETCRKEK